MEQNLLTYLGNFVTDRRNELFKQILSNRTRYLTVVLEDIYQSQNASAVLRTCDCFGIQDVHIIENSNEYLLNPDVTLGSDKWINLHKYNAKPHNTTNTLKHLKSKGYRIIATTPHKNDVDLEAFDLEKGKTALLFGTELRGLSKEALDEADGYLKIPMLGFTESFNISVSAAIILHHLRNKLNNSNINWQLAPIEQDEILLNWYRRSLKDSERIIEKFLSQHK